MMTFVYEIKVHTRSALPYHIFAAADHIYNYLKTIAAATQSFLML
jgi:hypothetical protein